MSVATALIQAGKKVLDKNEMPSAQELSLTVSNAEAGLNLVMLGIAQKQADRMVRVEKVMDLLEEQLFDPAAIEKMTQDERMALYKEVKGTHKQGSDFIRQTRDDVNVSQLQMDMLSNDKEAKRAVGAEDRISSKVIREQLIKTVSQKYTIQSDAPGARVAEAEVV